MMLIIALALQAAAPTAEAEALGRRLAASGVMATLVPFMAERDLAELASAHPELTPAERARLIEVGRASARAEQERLTAAMGHAYAVRLSVEDLRVLVADSERAATARWRDALPGAIAQAMSEAGSVDLKAQAAEAFCREAGKLCPRR